MQLPPEPEELDKPRPRQLRMIRPNLLDLPATVVPSGFCLRTYVPGDESAWAEMMNSPQGIGTGWTSDRVSEKLISLPQFEPACLFFAADQSNGRPVATATAWRVRPEDRDVGHLHMVAALPSHRGLGFGRLVCVAALRYLRDHRFQSAALNTDDHRLPAIATYLGLGFVPDYCDDPVSDHRARWSAVFARLSELRHARG